MVLRLAANRGMLPSLVRSAVLHHLRNLCHGRRGLHWRDEPDPLAHPAHAGRAPGGLRPWPCPLAARDAARSREPTGRRCCARSSGMRKAPPDALGRDHIDPAVLRVMGRAATPRLRARQHAGSGLRRPAAADRLRPDHLAAVHRRADDRSAGGRAGRRGARGRHRLGLPGRGAGRAGRRGPQHRDHSGPGRDRRASDWARRASPTSRPTWATATTASRPRRPSMPSWSPPPPPACRRP